MHVESLRGDIRGTFLGPFSLLGASRPASVPSEFVGDPRSRPVERRHVQ